MHVHPNRYVFMKYFVEVFSGALVVLYHYIPSRLNSPLPRVQASISFESDYLFLFVFLFSMSVCKMYHSSSRASLEIIVVSWWRLGCDVGCDVACGETGYPQRILGHKNSKTREIETQGTSGLEELLYGVVTRR